VRRLQAVAQNGLRYTSDPFDRRRFEEVRAVAAEVGALVGAPVEELAATFAAESGHACPKLDVRAAAFRDGRMLLVRGADDGLWTPPGGVQSPSSAPRTSRICSPRNAAARTSTLGHACPDSAANDAASSSTGAPPSAATSAATARTSSNRSRSNGSEVYRSPFWPTACRRCTHSSHGDAFSRT